MASLIGRIGRRAGAVLPPRWTRGFSRPAALTFHGVSARPLDPSLHSSHHDADTFEAILRGLKAHFDLLPLPLLGEALAQPQRHRRSLFLTSDDGYANVAYVAAPILSAHAVPWALFVSTAHIDSGLVEPTLIVRLFCALAPAGDYAFAHLPRLRLGQTGRDAAAGVVLAQLKRLDWTIAANSLAGMTGALQWAGLGGVLSQVPDERFLTWPELRALAQSGVSVGAHGHHHWPLNAAQSAATLRMQAAASRQRLFSELGGCFGFAYPHGNTADVAPAAWRAVRDAGHGFAFTTLSGTLDAARNPFLLPRYSLALQDRNAAALIGLLAAGNRRIARFEHSLAA